MMQVSRTALREAVKTLEAEGIVEVLNGKGIYVGNRSRGSNAIESLIGFTREREALIERSSQKGDGDRVDSYGSKECHRQECRARRDHRSLMKKVRVGEPDTEEDKQFHEKIYQMCHNSVYYAVLKVLDEYTDKLWQFPLDIEDPFKQACRTMRRSMSVERAGY